MPGKTFAISLTMLIIAIIAYIIGITQNIATMHEISLEVLGASLVAVIVSLALEG